MLETAQNRQEFIVRLEEIEQIVSSDDLLLDENLKGVQKWGFSWVVRIITSPIYYLFCDDPFSDVRMDRVAEELKEYVDLNQHHFFTRDASDETKIAELRERIEAISTRITTPLKTRTHYCYDEVLDRVLKRPKQRLANLERARAEEQRTRAEAERREERRRRAGAERQDERRREQQQRRRAERPFFTVPPADLPQGNHSGWRVGEESFEQWWENWQRNAAASRQARHERRDRQRAQFARQEEALRNRNAHWEELLRRMNEGVRSEDALRARANREGQRVREEALHQAEQEAARAAEEAARQERARASEEVEAARLAEIAQVQPYLEELFRPILQGLVDRGECESLEITSSQLLDRVFRQWARTNHPDRAPPAEWQQANERFQDIRRKIELLKETKAEQGAEGW